MGLTAAAARLPLPANLLRVRRPRDRAPRPAARHRPRRSPPASLPPVLPGRLRPGPLMDEKKLLVAVALSIGFLLLWTMVFTPPAPQHPGPAAGAPGAQTRGATAGSTAPAPAPAAGEPRPGAP